MPFDSKTVFIQTESMKYINLLILIIIVFATQYLVTTPEAVSLETHSRMQIEIREIIEKALQDNIPNVNDFKLMRVQSEVIDTDNVKLNFTYSYKIVDVTQGSSKTENSGHVLLKRIQDNQWSFESAQINDQKIEFSDPIVITPEALPDEVPTN